MKNNQIILIAFIFGIIMTTNAQIPNAGFENWTSGNPDGWATSNVFPIGLVNITQTSDNHSGSYAVRGAVVNFNGFPIGPMIQSGPGGHGFPISEQYHSFELYYKFSPTGGDKFAVNVALTLGGNPIAQGAVALPASVDIYTHLTVPLTYTIDDTPDTAYIQISIVGPVSGPDSHVGSLMFVDDLSFSLSTGIGNISLSDLSGNCYPNPSIDVINIPLSGNVSGEVILNVFDTYGKEVKKITGQPKKNVKNVFQFSVKNLSPGLYFYSVDGQKRQCHGKFTVSRQ